jgi:hypothetical protein
MKLWPYAYCIAITVSLWGATAWGNDIDLSQNDARRDEMLQGFEARTRSCYCEAMLTLAAHGVSDFGNLVTFAHQSCSGPLYNYLTKDLGKSDEQVNAYLRAVMIKSVGDLRITQRVIHLYSLE